MKKVKLFILAGMFIAGLLATGAWYLSNSVEADAKQLTSTTVAGPPAISSWLLNRTGATGYNGIAAAVQQVRYSTNFVYVNSTSIPTYSIGPWTANPNTPSNQSFQFKIPRNPVVQNAAKTATGLGAMAFWTDGVAIFNALDGFSYNNLNIWHQDAVVNEGISFDSCSGHPAPTGTYHHHRNPNCLYNITPSSHSPIVGFAFDGFPIYGAYAYANTNGTGGIKRITSSYRLRSITDRTTLPNGTVLAPNQVGPALTTKALGTYVEDYEYVSGLGDLDQYNGRFAVTPEYPNGIYAYYVTIYADGSSAYPYYIGPSYYGVVATENITSRGHVTITEPVTNYIPTAYSDYDGDGKTDISIYRPSVGEWYFQRSSNSVVNGTQFGSSTDKPAPADYTGDGKTDIAFYRPSSGTWFVLRSEDSSFFALPFGISTDIACPGDFDGDTKADQAVFRPSTGVWYINKSSGGVTITTFGTDGDRPVVADYDGDGKSDSAIFRPSVGEWYTLRSSDGQVRGNQFGSATDKTVQGDYTGDGKADFAFYRPSTGSWFVLRSEDSSFFASPFGNATDTPTIGDYDGDGKFDQAVFRSSTGQWILNRSTAGVQFATFGTSTDIAVPAYYLQ